MGCATAREIAVAGGRSSEESGDMGEAGRRSESRASAGAHPGLLAFRGAIGVEKALLDAVDEHLRREGTDAGNARPFRIPSNPVRIIVPSRALADHVASSLVRHRGRSVLGVAVSTLHGLAWLIHDAAGASPPIESPLVEIIARRHAKAAPALLPLEEHVDGARCVVATVRDLVDAGLAPDSVPALDEILAREGESAEIARARAALAVTRETLADLERLGLSTTAQLLTSSARLLRDDPSLLPSAGILVHGFTDATGAATELLRALVETRDARVFLDRPRDPGAAPGDGGLSFGGRLAQALFLCEPPRPPGNDTTLPDLTLIEARGAQVEAREVARRIRSLLDGGLAPERVAVVARQLSSHIEPFALHLDRLGIPFSSPGLPGALLPEGRRIRAMLDLLQQGTDLPTDRWLDARGTRRQDHDLRLALRTLGAGRLSGTAGLTLPDSFGDTDRYRLPVRRGFFVREEDTDTEEEDGAEEEGEEPDTLLDDASHDPDAAGSTRGKGSFAYHRSVRGRDLRILPRRARALLSRLDEWPDETSFSEHRRRLVALVTEDLHWKESSTEARLLAESLDAIAEGTPDALPITREELRVLLERALRGKGCAPWGGRGGGVQVLDVMAARGLTFEHLFLVGINRDVFPRPIQENPLLPDRLRSRLRANLPALPLKLDGHHEERFLFAQLLSAAPRVTISWLVLDDDGRQKNASPLVQRLRLSEAGRSLVATCPPSLLASPGERECDERDEDHPLLRVIPALPPDEEAIHAGIHGSRAHHARALPFAMQEAMHWIGSTRPRKEIAHAATARVRVLAEIEPDLTSHEGRTTRGRLGPYHGFIGPAGDGDPRRAPLFVTTIEALVRCPWRTFLEKVLRLEPPPDPLESLPGASPMAQGSLVHAVLEKLVLLALEQSPAERTLDHVLARPATLVPRPSREEVERTLLACAEKTARDEGLAGEGRARLLAEQVRPLVEKALELEWSDENPLRVAGVEVLGEVALQTQEGPRTLSFKADRVDRDETRALLIDYKTGRVPGTREREPATIGQGNWLQGAAYALAAGSGATGRYLYLSTRKEMPPEERRLDIRLDDAAREAFGAAVGSALGVWERGILFPRLLDPDDLGIQGKSCKFCEVKTACLQGDSGARRRLKIWLEAQRESGDARAEPQATLVGLYDLPRTREAPPPEQAGATSDGETP